MLSLPIEEVVIPLALIARTQQLIDLPHFGLVIERLIIDLKHFMHVVTSKVAAIDIACRRFDGLALF